MLFMGIQNYSVCPEPRETPEYLHSKDETVNFTQSLAAAFPLCETSTSLELKDGEADDACCRNKRAPTNLTFHSVMPLHCPLPTIGH